jgi:hypothetical protein
MSHAARNAAYRAEYRQTLVGPRYNGALHIGLSTLVTLSAIAVSALMIEAPTLLEWMTVPIGFLVANFAEYMGHRYPMHHALPGLRKMCVRHAGQHHRFYTHRHMAADERRDWHIVLFPFVIMAFFLGGIATPLALLMFAIATPNVGWFFVATAAGYCLFYEWMHLAYHQHVDTFIGRRPLVRKLRMLHLVHHDPHQMTKHNFNITFPIFDLVFGTYLSGAGYDVAGQQRPNDEIVDDDAAEPAVG